MQDHEIIALYWKRDEAALEATAEKYGSRLRSLAYAVIKDRQTAEECENDTYMEAWNCIPPHRPEDYFYAFLARITRHLALNCCRDRERLKRNTHIVQIGAELDQCLPAVDNTENYIDELVLCTSLNRFLATLSSEKRNIFLRRYWYMDSITEIAERYSLSESNVKTTLFRTRKKLRGYLTQEGYRL